MANSARNSSEQVSFGASATSDGTNALDHAVRARGPGLRDAKGNWTFELSRDEWKHLQLTDANQVVYKDVSVIPLFPVTSNQEWVSITSSEGDELVCLNNLDGLSATNRGLIEDELSYREFVPHIQRVISVSGNTEPCEWIVETNYGVTSFVLKAEEDVRRVNARTVNIVDATGVRFRVEDMRKLDSRSRAFVEWYV